MRIHRLELQAFGPFAERQTVNFDALGSHGLFLLNGPTGAGKSSVLDAICYAFYGSVPGARQSAKRLRSDHAPAGLAPEVVCEFSARGRRFEVTRNPQWERPAKRGGGTTTEQARTLLKERAGGEWVQKSARNDEAGAELQVLLGMDREQFTRVVLLPQGDFAAFLRADAKSRRELLQRLFSTDRFENVEKYLAERAQAAGVALAEAETGCAHIRRRALDEVHRHGIAMDHSTEPTGGDGNLWSLDELRGTLATVLTAETVAESALKHRMDAARAGHGRIAMERKRRLALEQLQKAEEGHRLEGTEIEDLRSVLNRHQRARILESGLRALDDARLQCDASRVKASATLSDAVRNPLVATHLDGDDPGAAPAVLAARLDEVCSQATSELGVLQASLPEEELLIRLERRLVENRAALATLRRTEETSAATLEELAVHTAELQLALGPLQEKAGEVAALRARLTEAERLVENIAKHRVAAGRISVAEKRFDAAQQRFLTLKELWLGKLSQRLEQAAAELAGRLRKGEDCPVCGGTEHPHPAEADAAGLITREEEQSAQRDQAAAEADVNAARASRDAVVLEAARLEALGGSADSEVADKALELLRQELAEAMIAETEAQHTVELLRETSLKTENLAAEQNSINQQITEVTSAAAGLQEQKEALVQKLNELKLGFESLAMRVDGLKISRNLLVAARDAHLDLSHAQLRLNGAELSLANDLQDSTFESPEQVRDALLEEAAYSAMEERVLLHERTGHRLQDERDHADIAEAVRGQSEGRPVPTEEEVVMAADNELVAVQEYERVALNTRLLEQSSLQLEGYARQLGEQEERLLPLRAEYEMIRAVADSARGGGDNQYKMSLSTYVLAARLEQVAAAATERLLAMSDGRYALVHSDLRSGNRKSGLGLNVIDGWTGVRRDTSTLSGGESFMASLAMALGLADVVQQEAGGTEIETLFVDEGFGSLDEQSLEQVMDALEGLRSGGRIVGLVSHVAELKQRIGAQLQVLKGRDGSTLRYVEQLQKV